jgi:hypothetical protein
MGIFRFAAAGVLVAALGWQSASAAPILMPAGSTVWMKFDASVAPDADLDDAAGSNLPGIAPPNGIPTTFVTDGTNSATGYAEILPNRIRTYIVSQLGAVMNASFQDTYTVGGSAAGAFDITVQLHVTGSMSTVPAGPFHQLLAGNVQAKIGTFNADPQVNENVRVTEFSAATMADTGAQSLFAQGSVPVNITASYTKTGVHVGDVFDLAYQVRSAFSKGELDLRNTGSISFVLPEGVTLTSALAQSIPEPGALALLAGCLALTARRRASIARSL